MWNFTARNDPTYRSGLDPLVASDLPPLFRCPQNGRFVPWYWWWKKLEKSWQEMEGKKSEIFLIINHSWVRRCFFWGFLGVWTVQVITETRRCSGVGRKGVRTMRKVVRIRAEIRQQRKTTTQTALSQHTQQITVRDSHCRSVGVYTCARFRSDTAWYLPAVCTSRQLICISTTNSDDSEHVEETPSLPPVLKRRPSERWRG